MKSIQRIITVIALTMLFSNMASATPINGKNECSYACCLKTLHTFLSFLIV